jgi:hypothetical protein
MVKKKSNAAWNEDSPLPSSSSHIKQGLQTLWHTYNENIDIKTFTT